MIYLSDSKQAVFSQHLESLRSSNKFRNAKTFPVYRGGETKYDDVSKGLCTLGYGTSCVGLLDKRHTHLALKMVGDHLFQAGVESLAVLVQNHRVRIAIQLLKAQTRVIFPLDFL